MSEQEHPAGPESKPEAANANVAAIDCDTGRTAAKLHKLVVEPEGDKASRSLGLLEQDLRMLHAKWNAVEQGIVERDEKLSALRKDYDRAKALADTRAQDLEIIATEKQLLVDSLQTAEAALADWNGKSARLENEISDRERALAESRAANEELLREKDALLLEVASQQEKMLDSLARVETTEAQNTALKVHLQELQDYIDGRKEDWDALNRKITEYEDAIKGMKKQIEAHDRVVAKKEKENADLAMQVLKLEKSLAELAGRQREKENSHAVLQQTVEDQSRELGSLNSEAIRLNKDVEKLHRKLEKKDATVRDLKKELKQKDSDSSSLEALISGEKSTIAELSAKLATASDRIADLEAEQKERSVAADEMAVTIGELRERLRLSQPAMNKQDSRIGKLETSLRESEASEQSLRSEVRALTQQLEEMSRHSAAHEIRAAELQALLLETEAEQKNIEAELEAQRELINVLENELSDKQQNLDVLDRSVDRLSAIGSGIRDLDMQIDDVWTEKNDEISSTTEAIFEAPDEVLIEPDVFFEEEKKPAMHIIMARLASAEQPERITLDREETIIGRSRKCDIRLQSKFISRKHVKIKVHGTRAIIEDAGSLNGFQVNSEHKTRHVLRHGDKLVIGDQKLEYLQSSAAE